MVIDERPSIPRRLAAASNCSFVCVFPLLFEPEDDDARRLLDPRLDDDEPCELDGEPLLLDFEPLRVVRRLEPALREDADRVPVDDARAPWLCDEPPLRDDDFSPALCRSEPSLALRSPLSLPSDPLLMSFFAAPAAAVVATPRATAPATFVLVERSPMCLSTTTSDRFVQCLPGTNGISATTVAETAAG